MNDPTRPDTEWEVMMSEQARHLEYPPTPDLTGALQQRLQPRSRRGYSPLLRWVAIIALCLFLILLTVPEVRAVMVRLIQIGSIQIIPATVTPLLPPRPEAGLGNTVIVSSVLDLPNQTTLTDAQQRTGFPIWLSADLPAPDRVYLQDGLAKLVTLVWLDDKDQVWLTLEILNTRLLAHKLIDIGHLEEVQVQGEPAYWIDSPHWVTYFFEREGWQLQRPVTGNVLDWRVGALTYRLEGNLTREEALSLAQTWGTPEP